MVIGVDATMEGWSAVAVLAVLAVGVLAGLAALGFVRPRLVGWQKTDSQTGAGSDSGRARPTSGNSGITARRFVPHRAR